MKSETSHAKQLSLKLDTIDKLKSSNKNKALILSVSSKRVIKSVEQWMMKKNYSKTRAARETGLSYTVFCSIMNGSSEMSQRSAIKMLHACDCKIAASQRR